jgi:hypothetical protein
VTDPVSRETVREFVTTIAAQAKAALKGMAKPGYLQISRLHPESEKLVPSRYKLDDVERMIDDAIAAASAGHNVYVEGRTIREDAARGNGRGTIEATAAVFALVADSDADKQMGWEPNGVTPTMCVETSPGNFQFWFFLRNAVPADIGKQLGERIRKSVNCDHDTGTITQPYRVAGTVNYPSKAKRERGRITVPTQLKSFNPEALWTPELLEQAFPDGGGGGGGGGEPSPQPDEADIPVGTLQIIRHGVTGSSDRSLAFFNVMRVLKPLGFTVDGVVNLLERYPNGIAQKYIKRLRPEIERIYNKLNQGPPPKKEKQEVILAELNRDNAVVRDGNRTMVLRFEEHQYEAGGQRYTYWTPEFLPFADFRNFYLNRYVGVGHDKNGNEVKISIGGWWLANPNRRQYAGVTFTPGGGRTSSMGGSICGTGSA